MAFDQEKYNRTYWENRNAWLYAIARDTRLSANAVRIALLIGTFVQAWSREEVRPGIEWIRKTAGIGSKTTVVKAVRELLELQYLRAIKLRRLNTMYALPFDGMEPWSPPSKNPQSTETVLIDISV